MWEPICWFLLGWGALALLGRAFASRWAMGEAVRALPVPRRRSVRPRC